MWGGFPSTPCLRATHIRFRRRRYRAILHNCQKHGVDAEARGNPRFREYLRGFAAYLNMVQPEEGAALLARVNQMLADPAAGRAELPPTDSEGNQP